MNFTSTQVLTEPSNGQARIEATNNGSQVPVTDISFSLAKGTFTDAIFNPFIGGTIGSPGRHGHGCGQGRYGQSLRHQPQRTASEMAQNFFTVVASNGEVIDSISLSSITGFGFTDLRQVRISGATVPSVPEMAQHCPCSVPVFWLSRIAMQIGLLRPRLVRHPRAATNSNDGRSFSYNNMRGSSRQFRALDK